MPTISSILSTANTALRTEQSALNVTAHNIANAATEGYARQTAVIGTNPALHTAQGVFGTGVRVADVTQVRDDLLDSNYRLENGDASQFQARSQMLSRVETVLGEPGEYALSGVLDQFLSAWSDLASNPTSGTTRSVVRQRGIELVDTMQGLAAGLDQVREDVENRIQVGVDRVNALTDTVARYNQQIVAMEAGGSTAGDLRDARNQALDELSTLLPIQVIPRANGSVGVTMAGLSIVDGAYSTPLQVGYSGATAGLEIVGSPGLLPTNGGSLGGLLQVLNSDMPAAVASLNDLAAALVADVNAIHNTGTNPLGTTGLDFFDPAGTTAWNIALSTDVLTSASNIAAGTPDGTGAYRAGANDVALGIGALRDQALGALGTTPGEHIRGLVSSIGLAVRSSADAAEVHRTLADQADTRRMSYSGVSVDEELVKMIQFQSAYAAAAKMVSAADEMLQTLLSI